MTSDRRATALGPLPRDWEVVALGNVLRRVVEPVQVDQTATYAEIGIRSHGKGIFYKAPVTGASLGNKRVFRIVPHSLVFNIVFAWEGAVAVTTAKELGMIASHRFPMFRPTEPPRVDVEFLWRFFQSQLGVQLLGDASPGGAGRNRTLGQKLTTEIPLPLPPIPEQRKIAAILSSVDNAIETTQAVIDQLQVVKHAMMAELFTRGIPGQHTEFKMTELGELPQEWEVVPLSTIAMVQTGIAKGKPVTNGVELPYLRVANVQDGHLDLSELKTIVIEASRVARYSLQDRDVLFTEGGDSDKLGRGCVWRGQVEPCLHQNHVFAVRPDRTRLLPEYLAFWAASPNGKSYFLDCAKQTTNLASINSTQLKALPVPLASHREQMEIVGAISSVDVRLEAEKATRSVQRELKSALMSALLTGEVRVQPDEA